jgi:hypothetical protein
MLSLETLYPPFCNALKACVGERRGLDRLTRSLA